MIVSEKVVVPHVEASAMGTRILSKKRACCSLNLRDRMLRPPGEVRLGADGVDLADIVPCGLL